MAGALHGPERIGVEVLPRMSSRSGSGRSRSGSTAIQTMATPRRASRRSKRAGLAALMSGGGLESSPRIVCDRIDRKARYDAPMIAHAHPMLRPPRRSTEEQARLDAALADLFERRITFNQTLGLKVESACCARAAHPLRRCARTGGPLPVRAAAWGRDLGHPRRDGGPGVDGGHRREACRRRHRTGAAPFARVSTIDLRIDYLRPGVGSRFTASARSAAWAGASARRRCA